MTVYSKTSTSIQVGEIYTLFHDETLTTTTSRTFTTQADTILASVFVTSITGSVDVRLISIAETGKEVDSITFPTITASTANLLLQKAAVTLSSCRIEVAVTGGPCVIDVRVRGMSTGEASSRLLGSRSARTKKYTVTTTPAILIPSAFTDRNGLVLLNNNASGILNISFSAATISTTDVWPIGPGGTLALDIAAGVDVYAVGTTTIDVRTMESGT